MIGMGSIFHLLRLIDYCKPLPFLRGMFDVCSEKRSDLCSAYLFSLKNEMHDNNSVFFAFIATGWSM